MARARDVRVADAQITIGPIAERIADTHVSCTSMVVNIFGDVVSQHGGTIWLGSLISALEPLGYNGRLVRTAVYRLIQQGWLHVTKVGRRSFYGFTETARRHYEKAARRIYSPGYMQWDGYWTLVLSTSIPDESKDDFRRSLLWQGFNPLVPGMYAHPSAERTSLDETLYDLDLVGSVIVFTAKTEDISSQAALRNLVQEKWNLPELEAMYSDFLAFYGPLVSGVSSPLSLQTSFLLRAVLTHDYRRILLRDPDIPEAMLPQDWPGFEAYELIKHMYKQLARPSVDYICDSMGSEEGPLPGPRESFYERFGGIPAK